MENLMVAVMVAVLLMALFRPPQSFTLRGQYIAAATLLSIGWGGVFIGLALSDKPLFQHEAFVSIWLGAFGTAAAILGPVYLVPALFESVRRLTRLKSRRKKRTDVV